MNVERASNQALARACHRVFISLKQPTEPSLQLPPLGSIADRRITIAIEDVALGVPEILFGLIGLGLLLLQSGESFSFLISRASRPRGIATGQQCERPDQTYQVKLHHAQRLKQSVFLRKIQIDRQLAAFISA